MESDFLDIINVTIAPKVGTLVIPGRATLKIVITVRYRIDLICVRSADNWGLTVIQESHCTSLATHRVHGRVDMMSVLTNNLSCSSTIL